LITYRRLGERVVFDDAGLELTQWMAGSLKLAWSDIEFVSLTPTLEKSEGGWRLRSNHLDLSGAGASLERDGLLVLGFVVKDRRPHLAALSSWWKRANWGARLRPMLDADEKFLPDQSLLSIDLYWKSGLDASRDALIDLFSARCRFDLVVHL
jgi:hypothetical protein